MKQTNLFEEQQPEVKTGAPAAMRPRLKGQNGKILEMLQQGPVTNHELARIALKYTSRISDIRKAGYDVRLVRHEESTGASVYELREEEID